MRDSRVFIARTRGKSLAPSYMMAIVTLPAEEVSMNTVHRILIGLAVAMLLPATAGAQKISYDIRHADFGALKTFAFRDSPTDQGTTDKTAAYNSPLIEERTQAAIAAQLEARGLRRDDVNPDMYVTTRRNFKTDYTVYAPYGWGLGYGYGWGWGPYYTGWGPSYGGSYYVDERTMGTLIVDVLDASTGQLLWRGLAEKHVHEHSSPEHRTKRVNEEVSKMFEKFPR
jgi:uncharacterized protein DUF4136